MHFPCSFSLVFCPAVSHGEITSSVPLSTVNTVAAQSNQQSTIQAVQTNTEQMLPEAEAEAEEGSLYTGTLVR